MYQLDGRIGILSAGVNLIDDCQDISFVLQSTSPCFCWMMNAAADLWSLSQENERWPRSFESASKKDQKIKAGEAAPNQRSSIPSPPLCLPSLDYSKQILGRFESIKRKNAIAAAVLHEAFAISEKGWMTQYFFLNFLKITSKLLLFNILTGYWIYIVSSAWNRFNHPADFSTKKMCLPTTLKFSQERFKG